MALKFVPIVLAVLHVVAAKPATTLQDLEVADDTMSVGSYIRETRAAAPQDYHKSYENEGDGEIGYSRKKSGGGKKGYQHFDSYHKKAGDNYEFEKQDSFGLDGKEQDGAYSHRDEQEQDGAYSHRDEQKVRNRKPRRRPDDVEEIEQFEEGRPEVEHEDLKEGAPDGNGGTEAHGHDVRDYTLPEKYTYGSGEEYNF
ncbi:uncharacterized protein LOC113520019 [Galleria mellonella]|uniref:Uncharacterized protein LOC113520019 n=1 Tax=Galleria mellonella TaxID=7137 RepID=A0ABM3MSL3_GALME|nr:uncharacterized protein LOC113520019 [Galleria mellonella]XP_052754171.1 uncharacterized protein LOC113520019 [Galleria mellonella]